MKGRSDHPDALWEEATVWQVGQRHKGWRLDRFLTERIPKLSRTRIQALIKQRIMLDWRDTAAPSTRLIPGGKVIAGFPRLFEIPKTFHFSVLYEDDEILAIDKPAGLVVHPTNGVRSNSVIEAIRRERNEPNLRLVHRLDRETSGVLLLAKTSEAARHWESALRNRRIEKTYLALVCRSPTAPSGIIDQPIARSKKSAVYVRRAVDPEGESAVTHYKVLGPLGNYCLLELKPKTGRCHQLRVHCEWLDCPIVGDPLYGQADETYLEYITGNPAGHRMRLHAWILEGDVNQRLYRIEAPRPNWAL